MDKFKHSVPYHTVNQIPNSEYTKHFKRIQKLDADAKKNIKDGKAENYDKEAGRLTSIQAKKITDSDKAYGRGLVAIEHGYYTIGEKFMSWYRHLTQPRTSKIENLLESWADDEE